MFRRSSRKSLLPVAAQKRLLSRDQRERTARICCLLLATSCLALAQAPSHGTPSTQVPAQLREVGIDQKLDTRLPLDLRFRDEQGASVTLGQYFGKRPVVLSFVYFSCPRLCSMQLNGLIKAVKALSFDAGNEYEILAVSFDSREKPELAKSKKASALQTYGRTAAADGWHFLTGDEESIRALTQAAGFRYSYDPKTDQFSHSSAIMIATPDGRLARYLFGIEYSARDLRLGLIEAAAGRIGSRVDQFLLYCFEYDPHTGRYTMAAINTLRASGVVVLAGLIGFIAISVRRERRHPELQHR